MSKSRNKVESEDDAGAAGWSRKDIDKANNASSGEPDMDSIKRHIRRELATITNNKNNKNQQQHTKRLSNC